MACARRAMLRAGILSGAGFLVPGAGAEPAAPELEIGRAVALAVTVAPEHTGILESSKDLTLWEPAGEELYGHGVPVTLLPEAAGEGDLFYRMKVKTRPEGGRAMWSLEGCRMTLTSAEGTFRVALTAAPAGLRADAAGGEEPVSWHWERTGRDEGRCVVTWASGGVETLTMQFLSPGAGVFSRVISSGGVTRGGAPGVFRMGPEESLEPAVPDTLDGQEIVFSGTGRPVKVAMAPGGTAVMSRGEPAVYAAAYAPDEGGVAALRLDGAGGVVHHYRLQFTGPGCGNYTAETSRQGVKRRAVSGHFAVGPP